MQQRRLGHDIPEPPRHARQRQQARDPSPSDADDGQRRREERDGDEDIDHCTVILAARRDSRPGDNPRLAPGIAPMCGVRGRRSVDGMTRLPAAAPCIRPWRRTGTLSLAIALLAILLTGCGGDDTSPNAATAATPSPARAAATQTSDADPDRRVRTRTEAGASAGSTPGTYTTVSFMPAITYTVPAGWANGEDLPGNFQLLLNADRRYLGIYKNANVPFKCQEHPDLRLSQTVSDYTRWLRRHPLLHVTTPVPSQSAGSAGCTWTSPRPRDPRQGVHLRGEHRQRAHHRRRARPGRPAPRDH